MKLLSLGRASLFLSVFCAVAQANALGALDWSLAKPKEDCTPVGAAVPSQNMSMIQQATLHAENVELGDVFELVGHCVASDNSVGLADRKIIPQLRELYKHPGEAMGRRPSDADYIKQMPDIIKDTGDKSTTEDWVAVDILARTIYSEVATTTACGNEYVLAIARLIRNRALMAEKNQAIKRQYMGANPRPNVDPVVNVALAPHQFAVWGGGDNANRWAGCPARNVKQKYPFTDPRGRPITSGKESYNRWSVSVEVAMIAIFREKYFMDRTKDFKDALHYTMGDVEHNNRIKQGYKHLENMTLSGAKINKRECVEVWEEPKPKAKRK